MIDALYNGISGLNVNQSALDSQTNNISNVNTVAFKADKISFADMMYQNSIGKGAGVSTVTKDFSQGNLKITSNPLDMAIDGKGYFIVKGQSQELNYTRSGNFRIATDGTLQMPNGLKVQGFATTQNEVKSTSTTDTKFTNDYDTFIASKVIKSADSQVVKTINAKTTNYNQSATDDPLINSGKDYKTKETKIQDIENILSKYRSELSSFSLENKTSIAPTYQESTVSFDKTLLTNEYSSVIITVGNNTIEQFYSNSADETLNKLSDKISLMKGMTSSVDANGTFTIKSLIPGEEVVVANASNNQNSNIVSNNPISTTTAIKGEGQARLDAFEDQVKNLLEQADAKYLRITNTVDSSNPESKTLGDIQMDLKQLNLSDSSFGQTEVDNGIVYVKQDDTRFAVGQIMIASFISEDGLIPKGDNIYSASAQSGEAIYANDISKVSNKKLELSNSDLAKGLVDLMVYQRAFEANSKSITTSDEFLKTAIQLKK